MDLQKILELHKKWLEGDADGCRADLSNAELRGANLSDANLSRANLRDAELRGANLSHANLDFACLSLSRGSLGMKVDRPLAAQIAYHFCSLKCDDPEVTALQKGLYGLANEMHRTDVPRLIN